ncbi:MAG: hypothetical protein RR427_09630 [Cellulosilyticaceae bacterium]
MGRIKCKVRLYHNDVLVEARKPEPIAIPHPPFIFKDMKKYLTRERTQIRVEGLIRFEVGGEGKIIGDQTIGANPIKPVLGQTGILVQATRKAGKIFIKATLEHPGRYSAVAIEEAYLEITSTY